MPVIFQNLIEIINSSVEMFLIFLYFSLQSKRRVGKVGYIAAYFLSVAALSASVLLTDEILLSLFITLGILIAVAFYCFEDTIRRRLLMIALYMLIISIADPLVSNRITVIVTNTSDEVNTEVLTTSKGKSGLHGIGISSIRSAAERLQGVSTFRYQDGIFTLRVVILNC